MWEGYPHSHLVIDIQLLNMMMGFLAADATRDATCTAPGAVAAIRFEQLRTAAKPLSRRRDYRTATGRGTEHSFVIKHPSRHRRKTADQTETRSDGS